MEPHPFSRFIAILGRGKTLSRPLDLAEAEEAMEMILRRDVLPEQVGAFMMLQRYKEEEPEEIAGFARAVRKTLELPTEIPKVDLDWSSYAGKRRQLPWFLLSALLLARNGFKVVMHGTEGHTAGRVYTRDAMDVLGLPVAASLDDAAAQVEASNFTYIPLEVMSQRLRELIELRPVFGLRSPVHTFTRLINPFDAPCVLQGIFHRGFMETHLGAGEILGVRSLAVFRGEGGEIERRPNKPTEVWSLQNGERLIEKWPVLMDDPRAPADHDMDISRMQSVWRGDVDDDYARAAVTGTLAIALRTLVQADSIEDAQSQADAMWDARDRSRLATAA